MIEIIIAILALCNVGLVVAVFVYFYNREKKQAAETQSVLDKTHAFYTEINKKSESVLTGTFNSYLKHIQNLEKMVLPKPVTQKMVEDVLKRTPPIVREVLVGDENSIEKNEDDGVQLNEENWRKVPIGQKTKVMFEEGNDLPTIIE